VIDVDPIRLDTESEQGIALSGQILLIGGASGIPDKQRAHGAPPELGPVEPQEAGGSGIGLCPTPPARTSNAVHARSAAGRNGIRI